MLNTRSNSTIESWIVSDAPQTGVVDVFTREEVIPEDIINVVMEETGSGLESIDETREVYGAPFFVQGGGIVLCLCDRFRSLNGARRNIEVLVLRHNGSYIKEYKFDEWFINHMDDPDEIIPLEQGTDFTRRQIARFVLLHATKFNIGALFTDSAIRLIQENCRGKE